MDDLYFQLGQFSDEFMEDDFPDPYLDLDFAYHLQLEEAITASMLNAPSSSFSADASSSSRSVHQQRGLRSSNLAVLPSHDFPKSEGLANNERRVSGSRLEGYDPRIEEIVKYMTGIVMVTDEPPRRKSEEEPSQ